MALNHQPHSRPTSLLRMLARALALMGVGPMLVGLWFQQAWTGEALLLTAITGVCLLAVVFAWRMEGIGGALVAMSGLAVGLVTCMVLGQMRLDVLFGIGGCEMVAGSLLMVCWFRDAQRPAESTPRVLSAASLHTPLLFLFDP